MSAACSLAILYSHSTGGDTVEIAAQLGAIDRATLTPLVRRACFSDTIEIGDWSYQPICGGANLAGAAVYRFTGSGLEQGKPVHWSLFLKVLGTAGGDEVVHCEDRELLAYQTGLLSDLPSDIAAPRCLGVTTPPGGGGWIWMEEIADAIGPRWPLAHYGTVARHLGNFNGAYLTGRPLPAQPWLSRSWLRRWVGQAAPGIAMLPSVQDHPLLKRMYPPELVDAYLQLWAERETFFTALARLPQTFCHLDVFRRNMFARRGADGQDQTVLIDWAFAGTGAIGEELAPLVLANVDFFEVEISRARELDQIVFDSYLAGLHDAGWRGDPRQVRFGYVTAAVLRYRITLAGLLLVMVRDEQSRAWIEQVMGHPIAECVEYWSTGTPFTKSLIAEAWALLGTL
jgi:hypothetical protein